VKAATVRTVKRRPYLRALYSRDFDFVSCARRSQLTAREPTLANSLGQRHMQLQIQIHFFTSALVAIAIVVAAVVVSAVVVVFFFSLVAQRYLNALMKIVLN